MKVVLYTYGLPFTGNSIHTGPLGGAESACIYLARSLKRLGHEVTVFCLCPSPGNYEGVVYRNIAEFEAWRSQGNCDLFICSRYYQVFSKTIPAKLKVLWLHDHLLKENAEEVKQVLANIDFIYCLSNYHAKYIAQFFTEGRKKIKITSNGVDLDFVQSVTKDIPTKKHKMMFTSRPERGLKEALFVYEKLGDKNLEFLVCTYPYPNEDIAKDYNTAVQNLNQKGFNIRFDQFNKQALYQNIAESKVVIYPSNTPEIFCISAVEAQACKTVFLGRQFGALKEVVGYPCQKDPNPLLFYEATKKVLVDDSFRQSLEQRGWQHVQKYTWEKVAKQFVEDAQQFVNQREIPLKSQASVTDSLHKPNQDQKTQIPKILILTPVKDACPFLPSYFKALSRLNYPPSHISLGFLEGDSKDDTYTELQKLLPSLKTHFRKVGLWQKNFGFHLPPWVHRADERIQFPRRVTLARSRNHLLSHALDDEDWVLWLDVDVIEYPPDIIQQLLQVQKPIVQPHCVLEYGGRTFDQNAWRDKGKYHLDSLRGEGNLVKLDAVGGSMLLVFADVHRDGLIFPAFPYGKENEKIRKDYWGGEVETEGLGMMALDMGIQPWGMPHLEIKHRNG